jgi:hypothetical protein
MVGQNRLKRLQNAENLQNANFRNKHFGRRGLIKQMFSPAGAKAMRSYGTVTIISVRTTKFRMCFFYDDRLAELRLAELRRDLS